MDEDPFDNPFAVIAGSPLLGGSSTGVCPSSGPSYLNDGDVFHTTGSDWAAAKAGEKRKQESIEDAAAFDMHKVSVDARNNAYAFANDPFANDRRPESFVSHNTAPSVDLSDIGADVFEVRSRPTQPATTHDVVHPCSREMCRRASDLTRKTLARYHRRSSKRSRSSPQKKQLISDLHAAASEAALEKQRQETEKWKGEVDRLRRCIASTNGDEETFVDAPQQAAPLLNHARPGDTNLDFLRADITRGLGEQLLAKHEGREPNKRHSSPTCCRYVKHFHPSMWQPCQTL